MTEPLPPASPAAESKPALGEADGKHPPWRTLAVIAAAGLGGWVAGALAVKGLLAAKGLPAAQLAWGTKGGAAGAHKAISWTELLQPGQATGATGKLSAFFRKLLQNPLAIGGAAGAAGGGAAGLGAAASKLGDVRQQLQEQTARTDALQEESAQLKAAMQEMHNPAPPTPPVAASGDRLEDIDGIGAVYANRLRTAGIASFAELAALPAERIKEIIGRKFRLSGKSIQSWIAQADARAKGSHTKTHED